MTAINPSSSPLCPHSQPTSFTVLIGATGGIGQAIARELCTTNHAVLLVGRNRTTLNHLHDELSRQFPSVATLAHACDLSDTTSQDHLTAFVQGLIADGHRIDSVIFNAGINDFAMLTDQSDAVLEQMMLVNVAYPLQLTKRLIPILDAQARHSQIINIGSTFGSIGYPCFSTYSASKFAIRGATEALGREYADSRVRFRYFAPRATKTTMNEDAVVAMNEALGVTMDDPTTVAKAVVAFLGNQKTSMHFGLPERFFAWLNRVLPNVVGKAVVKDLSTIKTYAKRG